MVQPAASGVAPRRGRRTTDAAQGQKRRRPAGVTGGGIEGGDVGGGCGVSAAVAAAVPEAVELVRRLLGSEVIGAVDVPR